jgi:hypothetical protein
MSLIRPASSVRVVRPLSARPLRCFGFATALFSLIACSPATPGPSDSATGGSGARGGGAGGSTATGGKGGSPSNTGGSGAGTGGSGSSATGGSGSGGTGSGSGGAGAGSGGKGGSGSGGSGQGGTSGGDAGGPSGDAGTGGTAGSTPPGERFSFFTASMAAMLKLAKDPKGFGGDLRYGQADGLTGADKICTDIAEMAVPGSGAKGWRAFLSAEKGPQGTPVNAIDRVGEGPWYDRKGRLIAMTKADLLFDRPRGADPAIINDLPNENGLPNSHPVPGQPEDDNHHFLTGSTAKGTLDATNTCLSWTTQETTPTTRPRTGFSFVAGGRRHWINGQVEGGCGAGVAVEENGAADPSMHFVGSGGGYGGIYCFALKP